MGFIKLLENKECCLFGHSNIASLIDEDATVANIKDAVQILGQRATKDDLVVFYYSGHVASVGSNRDVSKVIFPTDGDFKSGVYLKISDIVESMNKIGAKNALVIIDG